MSHYGPMFETHDITGWTALQLVIWVGSHPDWADAEIRSCTCDICGDVTELVRPVK